MAEDNTSETPSTTWLAIEDYFNYFLPGILWVVDLLVLFYIIGHETIDINQAIAEKVLQNQFVLIAAGLIVPFLIGIMLTFFGNAVHCLDKRLFGEPEKYVLNDKEAENKYSLGKTFRNHLGRELSDKTRKIIEEAFGYQVQSDSLYYAVQYSLEFAPFATIQARISRLTNLISLHEGLISPLFVGVILAFVSSCTLHIPGLRILGGLVLAVFFGVW